MVRLFRILFSESSFKKVRRHFRPKFLDSLRLTVKGGHGGNGLPKYGGVGGQGGCVYLLAKNDIDLKNVLTKHPQKRISADSGEDSSKLRILGRRGLDEKIEVPVGVQIYDETGKLLGDLNEENSKCIVAGGGMGGCTATSFLGKPGDSRTITLDLKLIADVGLVGFPNAGKSTLLKAISNASPKIASYPFTTIRPQLGIIEYKDLRKISVADLPGLIEGAHENVGMGHKFLKHIERTRLFLMIVDIFGFQLSQSHKKRDCIENIYALNKELELYDEQLLDKPCILLINKIDMNDAKDEYKKIKKILYDLEKNIDKCPEEIRPSKLINFDRIIPISAKENVKIDLVKNELRNILEEYARKQITEEYENNLKNDIELKLKEKGPRVT